MKLIKLSTGHFCKVDDEDFERVSAYSWSLWKSKDHCYAMVSNRIGQNMRMHRLIMSPKQGEVIDHIDGDGLNNQKANLRVTTQKNNCKNKRKLKAKSSIYKGVQAPSRSNGPRWLSSIVLSGRRTTLGYFNTEKEAAIAYNNAAEKFHGEFACLNKV